MRWRVDRCPGKGAHVCGEHRVRDVMANEGIYDTKNVANRRLIRFPCHEHRDDIDGRRSGLETDRPRFEIYYTVV